MTRTALRQQPDLVIQFVHFATHPGATLELLYDHLDLDLPDLDLGGIHAPRLGYRHDDPCWIAGVEEHGIDDRFLVS
jgi:hypothetical protein